jgi:hypothetical protein
MKNQSPRDMTPNLIRDTVLKRMLKMKPKLHKHDDDHSAVKKAASKGG